MKNIITVSVLFSFKGETHTPSITIELDEHIQSKDDLSFCYPLIAKANNYDLYSYEYEMMQAQDITYSDAQGLVADFINDGQLDLKAFKKEWQKNKIMNQLQIIAKDHMQIEDLQQHSELTQTLLKAFQLGQKNPE